MRTTRLLLTALIAIGFLGVPVRADDRPNAPFIMSGDHALEAISAYGSHR